METKPWMLHLKNLYEEAPLYRISTGDRLIIFSDLHMGNGSKRDVFKKNAALFLMILKQYYLEKGFQLILNGDVEELHKFNLHRIQTSWHAVYDLFDQFNKQDRLIKIIGNHDRLLKSERNYPLAHRLVDAIRLQLNDIPFFLFHSDQASDFYVKYNHFSGFLLRYIANPLYIHATSVAYHSMRQFLVEKRVYEFSRLHQIISIIGHTHRPLFESFSKVDFLKYKIEQLCRDYDLADARTRQSIEEEISVFKDELQIKLRKRGHKELSSYVYNADYILPCVFNSGTVTGRRGITGIEIQGGRIALVHWFDDRKLKKYFKLYDNQPEESCHSGCYRMVLKEDSLSYIYNRIKLLA